MTLNTGGNKRTQLVIVIMDLFYRALFSTLIPVNFFKVLYE